MLAVETWNLSQIKDYLEKKLLILDPEYQRRGVWKTKNQILLIDSIARKMPVGAITLFKVKTKGYSQYEVIDGKQRLSALSKYLLGDLAMDANVIQDFKNTSDENTIESKLADEIIEKKTYNELAFPEKNAFEEYKFPVFIIEGQREDAVNAFVRMNSELYGLKPQEIRNAIFNKSKLLVSACSLSDELSSKFSKEGSSFFVDLGVITADNFARMHDIQFLLELLILKAEGVQHRRDTIDKNCQVYANPTGDLAKVLNESVNFIKKALEQIWIIFEGLSLKSFHFPSNCENDLYAMIGAFKTRGLLSQAQLNSSRTDLANAISEFRRLVTLYLAALKNNEDLKEDLPDIIKDYASTFISGQINSDKRRTKRIEVFTQVINDVIETIDADSFSDLQRSILWAMSRDKVCARCKKVVSYAEYHAGHKIPRAKGGKSVIQNGQIEHAKCNMSAGAK